MIVGRQHVHRSAGEPGREALNIPKRLFQGGARQPRYAPNRVFQRRVVKIKALEKHDLIHSRTSSRRRKPTAQERPKSSFFCSALMCTTRHWISARASTNQGSKKRPFDPALTAGEQQWHQTAQACLRLPIRSQSSIIPHLPTSLICAGSHRNPAACGANQGSLKSPFDH